MKVATHLHLVPRLRMCGAVSPLPKYAFIEWCLIKEWIQLMPNDNTMKENEASSVTGKGSKRQT